MILGRAADLVTPKRAPGGAEVGIEGIAGLLVGPVVHRRAPHCGRRLSSFRSLAKFTAIRRAASPIRRCIAMRYPTFSTAAQSEQFDTDSANDPAQI